MYKLNVDKTVFTHTYIPAIARLLDEHCRCEIAYDAIDQYFPIDDKSFHVFKAFAGLVGEQVLQTRGEQIEAFAKQHDCEVAVDDETGNLIFTKRIAA